VEWFEEPVSSDDLAALRSLRQSMPACKEVATGEYGYTLDYSRRMLEARSMAPSHPTCRDPIADSNSGMRTRGNT
jgi:L-alanine-DL-glutamate epimerase-like enolase superfamily enzyme